MNLSSTTQKYLAAGAILATWGAFAFAGKTPVDGFISALGSALTGLGVWHAATAGKPPQS
jgi:hypothetical protein